jgi:hypothetical protein
VTVESLKDGVFEKHHPRARILEELFRNVPCLETSVCSSQAGFLFMFDIGTGTMLVRSRVSQERDLSWISKNWLHTFVRFKIAVWSCVENATVITVQN